jgi:hypothetical protein
MQRSKIRCRTSALFGILTVLCSHLVGFMTMGNEMVVHLTLVSFWEAGGAWEALCGRNSDGRHGMAGMAGYKKLIPQCRHSQVNESIETDSHISSSSSPCVPTYDDVRWKMKNGAFCACFDTSMHNDY